MTTDDTPRARTVEAGADDEGQRIDNYLIKKLKGVPRTRIYKALRKGEVRVNGSRKKPTYHVKQGDQVRIPPIRHATPSGGVAIPRRLLDHVPVIFEDDVMLVVNKPAGLAVHGGTGMDYGLIEALRELRPELDFIELVHRLDRDTSGCLMLAKSRSALVGLQDQLSSTRSIRKYYLALLFQQLHDDSREANFTLQQIRDEDGMKRVVVDKNGQQAQTVFTVKERYQDATLVEAQLHTGRMHQARVHAMAIGHPIAGDRLYGDRSFNQEMKKLGLGRMFLHAERLRVYHPLSGSQQDFFAPLPPALQDVLARL